MLIGDEKENTVIYSKFTIEWFFIISLVVISIFFSLLVFSDSKIGSILCLLFPIVVGYYSPRVLKITEVEILYFSIFKGFSKVNISCVYKLSMVTSASRVLNVISIYFEDGDVVYFSAGTTENTKKTIIFFKEKIKGIILSELVYSKLKERK